MTIYLLVRHMLAHTAHGLYRVIICVTDYLPLKIVREKGISLSFQNQRKAADFETEEHTCYTPVTLSEATGEQMIYKRYALSFFIQSDTLPFALF